VPSLFSTLSGCEKDRQFRHPMRQSIHQRRIKAGMNMVGKVLDVNGLKVDFLIRGKPVTAVEDVSFPLYQGETLCIVGESGCGKSVTATAIMQLYNPETAIITGNSVMYNGIDLLRCGDRKMRSMRGNEISMIFQEPMTSLNPVYRIETQMMEMVLAHRNMSHKAAWDYCVEMLRQVRIPDPERRMKEFPHQFSGGMRQRVMIAMALSCQPKILIADEPTTALDVTIQAQILELINELKEKLGTSIILITHDMGVVAEMADHAIVMYAGKVMEYNTTRGLFKSPLHPYTQGLVRAIPALAEDSDQDLYTIEGNVPSLQNMPKKGCRFADRCGACTARCRDEEPRYIDYGGGIVRCHRYESSEVKA